MRLKLKPNLPLPGWLKAELVAAERDYARAQRIMRRCKRAMDKLIDAGKRSRRRDDWAYDRCGVGLADRRCLRTYRRLRELTAQAAKICQV
jgi:hypothetical protein